MALILKLIWDYRKAILWVVVALAAAVLIMRILAWKESHETLKTVQQELLDERACALGTACHDRAAKLAEQARQEAALKAQEALQAAEKAEAKARADAAAWRKRYEAALRDDPDCADWSRRPIQCPL